MSGRNSIADTSTVSSPLGNLLPDMRRRGVRGGIIPKHRALINYKISPAIFLFNILVLPLLLVGAMLLLLNPLFAAWNVFFESMRGALDLPGAVAVKTYEVLGPVSFSIPYLTTGAQWPDGNTWWISTVVTAALLLVSFFLPNRFLPLAYFLRAIVGIQATALVYFSVSGGPFPYQLPEYMAGLLAAGCALLVITPMLFGLTFYIFNIPWRKKLLLTVLALAHLALLLPMQALLHAYIIHYASLMMMPVLFFIFGLLLDILVLMAFYSWGMSWPPARDTDHDSPKRGPHP